jgi:hypothetical protein
MRPKLTQSRLPETRYLYLIILRQAHASPLPGMS